MIFGYNSPENIFNDNNSFLHHVVNFGLNQIQQRRDAALRRRLHFDRAPTDRSHRFPDEVNVNL